MTTGTVSRPSISVVVPVYNSEGTLRDLVARLQPVLDSCAAQFEVLLVNDGSRDASWRVIQELGAQHSWVHGIDLMRNYGQHNALLCGVRAARRQLIVTLDDDLQNPPEEIPRLLERLRAGADVVYGAPERQRHGLLRDFASAITKLVLQGAMGAQTARRISAFRAFHSHIREAFASFRGPFANLDVLLTWGAARFDHVTVRHDARTVGASNYTVSKLIRHALNMMTGFSTIPLQAASLAGFTCTLFGLGILIFVLVRYLLEGSPVAGFPFLASIIAIFAGAQLFALGIIGEYLARMHFRTMDRPTYAIRQMTEGAEATDERP